MTDNNVPKKRSSLKMSNCLTEEELKALQKRYKRLSVNWDSSLKSIDLQTIKTSFEQIDKEKVDRCVKKDPKFEEARRKSIKNEFTKVKEMLKDYDLYEDLEADRDITLQNTKMNYEVGKLSTDSNEKSVENDN